MKEFHYQNLEIVEPIKGDGFLQVLSENINECKEVSELAVPVEEVKERLSEVKNKVLESLKCRWIKPGPQSRRNSNASQLSTQSKRDRESPDVESRSPCLRFSSPTKF